MSLERLSVMCFAGTYGLALASDLTRFVVRSRLRWYLTVGLIVLGWLVQTAYLGNLAWQSRELPITTVFESLLVLSWILVATALYLIIRSPRPVAVGLFILPLVLILVTAAGVSAPRASWADWGGWVQFWGMVHGLFLVGGAVASCVALVAGLMHLVQARRLKRKRPGGSGVALPSLERSERLNSVAITVAYPLLTSGLAIGVAMEAALHRTAGGVLGWTDPKVLSGAVTWLVFTALVHARFRPEMRGRRVMVLTAVACAFLLFTFIGVDLLLPTAHGVPRGE